MTVALHRPVKRAVTINNVDHVVELRPLIQYRLGGSAELAGAELTIRVKGHRRGYVVSLERILGVALADNRQLFKAEKRRRSRLKAMGITRRTW